MILIRWLIGHPGPHFSVHDLFEGWVEALRGLGEDVFTFNLGDRISFYDAAHVPAGVTDEDGREAMRKAFDRGTALETAAHEILRGVFLCWPDVVLLVSAFWYPPYLLDAMRGRGIKVVLLHSETPYQTDEQLIRAAHADINLLNDPTGIELYRDLGVPAAYMPHAYRSTVHYPALPGSVEKWDLAFVGTGFPSRVKFFEAMDLTDLDIRLAGPWLDLPADSPLRDWTATALDGCVDNTDTAAIYRESRAGINLYRREGEDTWTGDAWAMGPREIELAACGLWFARDSRPESDEVFPMLPSFGGPEEAGEQIRWALAHPDQRAEAAAKARAAIEDRTFDSNAKALMRMIR